MLKIDLSGKRAFVAGVSDDGGFGFAIAKHLAMAGATPIMGIPSFTASLMAIVSSLVSMTKMASLNMSSIR